MLFRSGGLSGAGDEGPDGVLGGGGEDDGRGAAGAGFDKSGGEACGGGTLLRVGKKEVGEDFANLRCRGARDCEGVAS